ncbi:MAG TPA: hypothetical protein VEY50_09420 [Lysobacter sp.]|nr:hypothetical protein [Lysobacter sp.]
MGKVRGGEIREHLLKDRTFDRRARDRALASMALVPPVAIALGPPLRAIRGVQQPAKKGLRNAIARRGRARLASRGLGLEAAQQLLGLVVGDQRLVRVPLDLPFRPRPALRAAAIAPAVSLRMHAPDGVAGVGEGVPLHPDQRAVRHAGQPRCARGAHARHAGRAIAQVPGDRFGACRVGLEDALGDGLAIAHRAGRSLHQAVAGRRPPAGTEALAHVLAHAGQALLPRRQAVPLVHRLQDGLQQHFRDRVGLRQRLVHDTHAVPLALDFLEDDRDVPASRNAAGVEHQQGVPPAVRVPDRLQQRLKAGPILVLAGLDRVGELLNDRQLPALGQLLQLPPLRVDRHVVPVLARAQVESSGSRHAGASGARPRGGRARPRPGAGPAG